MHSEPDDNTTHGPRLDLVLLLAAAAGGSAGLLWGFFARSGPRLGWLHDAGMALVHLSIGAIFAVVAVAGFRLITRSNESK